ncbi:MAG: HupE/UreJ family protein [Deltaproteobacteria bacterium]|nr:HupE/UreJ family protein [Deltaproteobacteria bacterium]
MKAWLPPAIVLALLLSPLAALAHQTADSRLEVEVRPLANEVDLLVLIPAPDLSDALSLKLGADGALDPEDLEPNRALITAYLRGTTGARRGGKTCEPTGEATLRLGEGKRHLLFLDTLRCTQDRGPLLLSHAALFETGRYKHLARIQVGDEVTTTVFSPGLARTSIPLEDRPGPAGRALSVVGSYLWLGVMHIWGGIDHVLFVICLLVVADRFRGLLGVITSFTAAHTITLLASALGAFSLSPGIVEPAIAASILYVAGENVWAAHTGREKISHGWRRYAVTFAFGLIHGFGFSYVLRDEVGLPTEALLPALLSFNVGVELGQVVVVAAAWPVLRWLSHKGYWKPLLFAAMTVVGIVAGYWLVTRLMG